MGEVLISLHDNEDAVYGVDVVPFLAASYDEARKLWAASRPVIERKFAAQGLMVLFAVPWPPQGIYAKKEINSVDDMRGLSWRVYNTGTQRIAQIVATGRRVAVQQQRRRRRRDGRGGCSCPPSRRHRQASGYPRRLSRPDPTGRAAASAWRRADRGSGTWPKRPGSAT